MKILALAMLLAATDVPSVQRSLATLHARTPISVTYERHHKNDAKGRFYTEKFDEKATADVRSGPEGLSVTLPPQGVEALRKHRAAPPDTQSPFGNVVPSRVAELIDYAPTLQSLLARSKLLNARGNVLTFRVASEQTGKSEIKFDSKGDDLLLTVGPDGVPLAAERRSKFSVGFLFLKFNGSINERYTFVRHGDRLVVTHYEREGKGSGMGQSSNGHEIEKVTVR